MGFVNRGHSTLTNLFDEAILSERLVDKVSHTAYLCVIPRRLAPSLAAGHSGCPECKAPTWLAAIFLSICLAGVNVPDIDTMPAPVEFEIPITLQAR